MTNQSFTKYSQALAQMFGTIMDTCTKADGRVTGGRQKDLTGTKTGGLIGYADYLIGK